VRGREAGEDHKIMHHIETLLRRNIGLDAASIGSSLIECTVRLRMKEHGLKKMEAYRELLAASPLELEHLIEAVVVTETWFFRDREPFNAFAQLALQDWRPRHPAGTLRVLSLPCSSGEEPYSLAMALLDAGLPDPAFAIAAADISASALARAEKAIYGKNSFRGRDLAFRDRHFVSTKEGYTLSPLVRRCVRFERGNVLDGGFLAGSAPYDYIFCRNLLIYFDRATQILALEKLHRLLAADGILFVGPAELPLVVESGFVNAGLPMAFACRKAALVAGADPSRSEIRGSRARPRPMMPAARRPPPAPDPRRHAPDAEPNLRVARHHADAGRLAEAAAICEAHLVSEGPSAQAYYLLALVKDAGNDPVATNYYRKALYLEPNHYEALVRLARALEKAGDVGAARIYQRRAVRAQPKS